MFLDEFRSQEAEDENDTEDRGGFQLVAKKNPIYRANAAASWNAQKKFQEPKKQQPNRNQDSIIIFSYQSLAIYQGTTR
jgi:hypothetical protein